MMKRLAGVLLLLGLLDSSAQAQGGLGLRISEFLASGGDDGAVVDEDGEAHDWIEIHNASAEAIDLAGWHLSNEEGSLTQWTFPAHVLAPGAYLIVLASGKDRRGAALGDDVTFHTNFRLAQEEEFLALVQPDGVTMASVFSPYPRQENAFSYGVLEGGEERYFGKPSPGKANEGGIEGFVSDPVFDVGRGFHDEPFALSLTCATEDARIRYTTDGSEPSLFSGETYTEPIQIEMTTVVRAVAQKSGYQSSSLVTHSYLFLQDVLRQKTESAVSAGWPDGRVNGQEFHYEVHPAMASRLGEPAMLAALEALPSLSIALDLEHLVDPMTGIYVNAEERGIEWERPATLELLHPSGEAGFKVACGLRIRGGISRGDEFPKHSFRVLFREQYGDAKLRYPLFEDEGVDEFDNVDLRSSTNWDWGTLGNFPPAARQNTLLRDINSRDTQGALGMPYTRSRYYHLYLNGFYWGIYMTQERAEASFAASYFGGGKEDYDVVKINRGPGSHTEATDGTLDAWRRLHSLSRAHEEQPNPETYWAMQGRNPDGSRNEELPVLLDIDRLIDYLLIIYWTANNDAPVSQWGDNDWANNWYGIYDHERENDGFHFFIHDAENSYGITGYELDLSRVITTENRTGPYMGNNYRNGVFAHFNPQFLHQDLMENRDYRLRFADRVERHCFRGGALTEEAVAARFRRRRDQVAPAIPVHSARWGHRFASEGRTYDERDWEKEVNRILTEFIPGRTEIFLGQLENDDLLSRIETPVFDQHGGFVSGGFEVFLNASLEGTQQIYFTTDGSDPRLPGGRLSPQAEVYDPEAGGIVLAASTTVRARVRQPTIFDLQGGDWSAVAEARFFVDADAADATNVVISEIHYHPAPPTTAEKEAGFTDERAFEFIELHNPLTELAVSLEGLRLADGIQFVFPDEAEVPAGGYLVVARDAAAFAQRYGVSAAGEFRGSLDNGGERVALVNAAHEVLHEVRYDDEPPWPEEADGDGVSLARIDGSRTGALEDEAAQWEASAVPGGTPGDGEDSVAPKAEEPGLEILSIHRLTEEEGLIVRWSTIPGEQYRLEYSESLEGEDWEPVSDSVVAEGDSLSETDSEPRRVGQEHGFYRVSRVE